MIYYYPDTTCEPINSNYILYIVMWSYLDTYGQVYRYIYYPFLYHI